MEKMSYTSKEKKEILDFIENHNKKYGRGGLTTAAKKFKPSKLTISNWIQQGDPNNVKKQLKSIQTQINRVEKELTIYKNDFEKVKKNLNKKK